MSNQPILVWFRNDLRLEDHAALTNALKTGRPVIPVYLHTPASESPWARGEASRWWLHHALADFAGQVEQKGGQLILRSGKDPESLLQGLIAETHAEAVYWNRRYDPSGIAVDKHLKQTLPAKSFSGSLLHEPHKIATQSGGHYKVYTPFYKNMMAMGDPEDPLPVPKPFRFPDAFPKSESLASWRLLPELDWDAGFSELWDPSAKGMAERVDAFLEEAVGDYKKDRDFPGEDGTSRMSPYLHFGQVSPRMLWHAASEAVSRHGVSEKGVDAWQRQLVWRDFAMHLLYHEPHLDRKPMQEKFHAFPWEENSEGLRAWQRGETGYPIVDAGMRALWATGWMHNRVRMIVASFLVKDLRIHWLEGAEWFWDTLVDADLANNSFGWQWAAGCGADAAPYFRIFNPVLQGKKFDGDGAYIRKWIPELRDVPDRYLHAPWEMDPPPKAYPAPIVDHGEARDRALEALSSLTEATDDT